MNPHDMDPLARAAGLGASTWSDALDAFGIEGVLQGIEMRSGSGTMAGFATTARHAVGALGAFDRADFAVGRLVASTGPGRVLVIDAGGVRVCEGDLLAGDATGIVIVPKADVERVLAEAERLYAVDLAVERGVEAGRTFAQAAADANYLTRG